MIKKENKKRVLSGIRATGRLHIGNYLGMVKGMLELQNDPEFEVFFMVADLHALTTPYDPLKLKENTLNVVLDYLSAGLNPDRASVFIQSQVREHVELAYLLSTDITIARLSHLPTFKEKVKQYPESSTMALLYYPILMAADILLYKTKMLPVGDDQLPHLEITREIAKKFNDKYKTDFPLPVQIKTDGHYIPSLTGEGKMSKSVPGSYINLVDSSEEIRTKLSKVPTDLGQGKKLPEKGGVATLLTLVELFEGVERRKQYEKTYKTDSIRYGNLKEELAQAISKDLAPIQQKRKELEARPKYIEQILEQGAERARLIAKETVAEVKKKMGLL